MAVPGVHAKQVCMQNKLAVLFFVASLAEFSILVCQHLTLVSLKVKAGKLHPAYTNVSNHYIPTQLNKLQSAL